MGWKSQDAAFGEDISTDYLDQLLQPTVGVDPLLAEIWDNEQGSAYDD